MSTTYNYRAFLTSLLILSVTFGFSQNKIQLSQTVDGTFSPRSVNSLNWMNDGQFYSALSDNKIIKYSVRTGEEVETIADGHELGITIASYSFSEDETRVLIMTDRQSIYRRSYTAVFYLYNRTDGSLKKLSEGRQSYATLSPDNSKVAFARDNNLFYVDLNTNEEVAITTDGKFNYIINGSADWVYEEELYLTQAFAWSADGKKIAFIRFDETEVREYNLQYWNEGALYPQDYRYKYPKAGEQNSEVEVRIYDVEDNETITADIGSEKDIYIPRIYWTKDANLLAVQRLNRLQNQMDLLHVNANNGSAKVVLTDKSDSYIHLTFCDDLTYLNNGKQFIYSTEKSGYKHFYLYNMDGSLVNQITSGEFEARTLVGLDQKKKILYYASTEDSPLELHLYAISLSGKGKKKLTDTPGRSTIDMSDDCSYYMKYHSSSTVPLNVSLYQTAGNKLVKVMEDNKALAEKVETYEWAEKEFFQLTLSNGTTLNGFFMKPADFSEDKTYPILFFQYSGPGSQVVANSWTSRHYLWHQYIVQQGYIVAAIDSRGTGYRGEAFKKMTYKQLGKYETEDMIEAAKIIGDYSYVDKDRMGIWGWSYGGYIAALAILKGADVFKSAIVVSPVSNWRFYDTIYTERYLQRPQENSSGYDDNSPLQHAERLQGNLLLVHGTGDDNVHYQNTVALHDKLIDHGKQFDAFFYPDRPHSMGNRRGHLYQLMADFILEKL
ncbi:MAG: S9 family peptidase [Ekhidna sp.]